MSEPRPARRVVSFGAYQCDLSAGELRKNGIKVKISDQPFRLLTALLEHPGEMVTRQELGERLWREGTFVGFEDSLNTAVNKLRTALDDESENPRFIETIPRRGYRFIAPTKAVALNERRQSLPSRPDADAEVNERSIRPAASRERQYLVWSVSAVAAVLFGVAVWWYTPLPPPHVIRVDQITTNARIDTPVEPFSDGSRVYYIERDGDHWNLMRTAVDGGEGQRIDVPAKNAMVMDISPDASQLLIGSFEKRDGQNQFWTMPVQGGAAKRLGNTTGAAAIFSPDGKQIAYTRESAIWIMDADGSNTRKVANLPDTATWMAWSPDGRRLRFTLGTLFSTSETSLWEISKDGRNLHVVFPGWTKPSSECCGSWTPDGRYYIFTSRRDGHANLWALRESRSLWHRSPRGPFQLTAGPDSPWGGKPSRDGRLIFFYNGLWREEMQRLDLKTGQFSLPIAGVDASETDFSHDGKWVSYIRHGGLFRSRADGSNRIELASVNVNPSFPRWSPDGKWIAFDEEIAGQAGAAYVVPSDGGKPQPLLTDTQDLRDADWSSDGRSLVVSRALGPKNSDGRELLIVDFATRNAEKIPESDGLAMSRWSFDGHFISATTEDQSQLKLWDASRREWSVIAHGAALGISVWSPDSRYLYFQDLLGKGESLFRYDIRQRHVEQVADFSAVLRSGVDRCALVAVEPDGAPVLGFNRSAYDLFAAEVRLP
jgi:Tol biopolymer transport system component/DNA-binding winged helix-turn-helix (wHTH) protein